MAQVRQMCQNSYLDKAGTDSVHYCSKKAKAKKVV